LIIKEFNNINKNEILNLFEKVFHKKMSIQFWNWRFGNKFIKKPLIKLAFIENKLVANYLLHPIILEFGGFGKKCLFSMTTMTDPEYAKQGIMTKLATEVYKKGTDELYCLVFLFANKNSRQLFTKKLNFKELTEIKELTLEYNNKKLNGIDETIEISDFDEQFDLFYKKNKKNLPKIKIPRVHSYLKWRFIENPITKYYCYKIEDGNNLVGYFVISKYKEKCQIVDFFIEEKEEYFIKMINTALKFCHEKKCKTISLWINKKLMLFKFLKSLGFNENSIKTYFCIKTLNESKPTVDYLDFNNWHITMSDSDVY
jgi:hypothetical protein